ncbi:MAG: TonB-dependent receptor, partial [Caulobacteraceae bacterium]
AGVINILTAPPSFKFGAEVELTGGNYASYGGSASITGPIAGDNVAGRLFVARRTRDGFIDIVTGAGPRTYAQDMNQDFWTLRGQMLFKSTDEKVQFRVIGDYSRRNEDCCVGVQISEGDAANSRAVLVNATRPGSVSATPGASNRVGYANRDTTSILDDKGVSLQGDIDLGVAKLTTISAFRSWENRRGQDADFTAADIYYRPTGEYIDRFDTLSQELRLAGETGKLNWLAGFFFADEQYRGQAPLIYGTDYYSYIAGRVLSNAPGLIGALPTNTFIPGTGQRDSFKQNDQTWALYTNDTYSLTSAWDVTVGVRYTSDRKRLNSVFTTTGSSCSRGRAAFPTLAGAVGIPTAAAIVGGLCLPWENDAFDATSGLQSKTEHEWSGTAKTSYRWTPGIMTYASYARGYKAGGFNFDRASTTLTFTPTAATLAISPTTAFAPETVNSFELGAKTQWFNNTLLLNATLFHQTFKNFQLNTFLGTSFIVESIPKVRSRGVDMDFRWRTPIDYFLIQGGVTYAQTEYGTFAASGLQEPSRFPALARLPGARLSFAPLWSGSLSGTFERPITGSGLSVRASMSAKYSSSYNTGSDLAPQKIQPAFTLVNARLGIGAESGAWTLEAWAQNLFNVEYQQVAYNGPLQGSETDPPNIRTYDAFRGQPRTFGATLRVKY